MGILSIVSTPIGNLGDVTLRALETLRTADVILCEDTRQTKKLLERHAVLGKQLVPYNAKRSGAQVTQIANWITEGKHLALVSDAGTPGISDPGVALVAALRLQFSEEALSIVPIPGASALITALSASGFPTDTFLFLGFLPHKKGRETLLREAVQSLRTVVFYESTHRLLKALAALAKLAPERNGMVAREMTKIHEEFRAGTFAELHAHYLAHPEKVRGECVVLLAPVRKGRSV